jgi:lipoprotein NlpI
MTRRSLVRKKREGEGKTVDALGSLTGTPTHRPLSLVHQPADYNAVIALDPLNSHAFHNRGISYDKKGMFEAAIADFTRVLELDSTNANAYFNRGSTHDSLGAYDKAIADYSRALDLDKQMSGGGVAGGLGGF